MGVSAAGQPQASPYTWPPDDESDPDLPSFLDTFREVQGDAAFLAPSPGTTLPAGETAPPIPLPPALALPLMLRGDTMVPTYGVQGQPGLTGRQTDDGQHVTISRDGWFGSTALTTLVIDRDAHGAPTGTLSDGHGTVLGRIDGSTIVLDPRASAGLRARSQDPATEAGGAGGRQPPTSSVRLDGECDEDANLGVSSPRDRLPQSNGHWTGTPGNSGWVSSDPEVQAITGGRPIQFHDGRVDFTPWAERSINVPHGTLTGIGTGDFTAAYQALANSRAFPGATTATEVENYLDAHNLTVHHATDTCLQIVPSQLNRSIPHIGSAADARFQQRAGDAQ